MALRESGKDHFTIILSARCRIMKIICGIFSKIPFGGSLTSCIRQSEPGLTRERHDSTTKIDGFRSYTTNSRVGSAFCTATRELGSRWAKPAISLFFSTLGAQLFCLWQVYLQKLPFYAIIYPTSKPKEVKRICKN